MIARLRIQDFRISGSGIKNQESASGVLERRSRKKRKNRKERKQGTKEKSFMPMRLKTRVLFSCPLTILGIFGIFGIVETIAGMLSTHNPRPPSSSSHLTSSHLNPTQLLTSHEPLTFRTDDHLFSSFAVNQTSVLSTLSASYSTLSLKKKPFPVMRDRLERPRKSRAEAWLRRKEER